MARGTHWWNEPPLWAWIAMVVGVVSVAVLLPIALQRTAPVEGATPAPASTSAGEASPSDDTPAAPGSSDAAESTSATEAARVVVVGDEDSAGESAWPVVLDEENDDLQVEVTAEVGAGYVTAGTEGQTLPDLAEQVDLDGADVVVVFGSRNDGPGIADEVARAADGLFDQVRGAAPDAELLVIGPPWFAGDVPAGVRNNRDVIRAAAESAGATFVDPLTEGWFADRSDLLTDAGNPDESGQIHLADLIGPEVRGLLPG